MKTRYMIIGIIALIPSVIVPAFAIPELDSIFELQSQEHAKFQDENLTVVFLNVLEDSRCPTDVTCVWQGKARLNFSMSQVIKTEIILDTLEKNIVTVFGKYQIELIDVKPYPIGTVPIKNEDYTAVLRISKIIQSDVLSPLKQSKSGILINDIQCKNDMQVLTIRSNGKIACVYEITAEKLGWKIIDPTISAKSVFEIINDDVSFDVDYSIKGGMVKDMTFDVLANSLLIKVDSSAVGNLTIEIPRELLDALMDYCPSHMDKPQDDTFFVLLDGEEILYDEILTNSESRTLKIHFLENTSTIEVIGTCLI